MELSNPVADIVASQELNQNYNSLKTLKARFVSEKGKVKFWFCSKNHKVTTCADFN